MITFALKTLFSALIIALASEIAKRSTALAALIIALPLNSILAFSLLYVDTHDKVKVEALSNGVLVLIVPSLLYFFLLPFCMRHGLGYWPASGIAAVSTVLANLVWLWLLKSCGVSV